MDREKSAATDKNNSHHMGDPPTTDKRRLKKDTQKGPEHTQANEKRHSKTVASRDHDYSQDDKDMGLDDEGDGDRNKGSNGEVDQSSDEITEDEEDSMDDLGSTSETDSFTEKYDNFRYWLRKATHEEVEKDFVVNKREILSLPATHRQNEQQQNDCRYLSWALRQIGRRLEVLEEGQTSEDDLASDQLPDSDPNKMWKMYGIAAENDTHYLVAWKGVDKKTGQAYGDEWTEKKNIDEKTGVNGRNTREKRRERISSLELWWAYFRCHCLDKVGMNKRWNEHMRI